MEKDPQNITLSKDEEESIVETGVSRQVVLQDKGFKFNGEPKTDPKFRDYLECLRQKLDKQGKLCYTKDVCVVIPGYKTRVPIPRICDADGECEEDLMCQRPMNDEIPAALLEKWSNTKK